MGHVSVTLSTLSVKFVEKTPASFYIQPVTSRCVFNVNEFTEIKYESSIIVFKHFSNIK